MKIKMCLQKMQGTAMTKSTSQKLLSALKKQNDFYGKQNLRDLTTEEYEEYQSMRNACVHYVRVPHIYFGTRPDVFAAAVSLLDVFLWKVKITMKHMTIVSAACFLIACKMLEEDEVQPSARQLASLPGYGWTANDLCRMELHILKKLDWNGCTMSYVEFLPVFADLAGHDIREICSRAVISLAERCLTQQSSVVVKPLVLAFCLFNHATNTSNSSSEFVSSTIHPDLDQLKSLTSEVDYCQKNLLQQSSTSCPSSLQTQVPRRSSAFPMKVFEKPSESGSPCLPTIMEE